MKTPNKLVLANLRQNKKRTRATLLAIILSCTLLFAVGIAFSSYMNKKINDSAKLEGSYHVLYYDVDYQKSKEYLENNKNIKVIYTMQQISKFESDESVIQVLSYSNELNSEIHISEGREPISDKEIIISRNSMYSLKLNVGDDYEGFNVVGVYDNNYILEEYPIGNGSIERNPTITFVTKKNIDPSNEHSCFFVTYKNIKKTYEYMEDDAKGLNLENTMIANVQANKKYLKENGVGQDEASYAMKILALTLTLYFISIFCMLIIYNAFAISLTERKKQFGILRSLGTSKKTIIVMITKELLILSLIAIPISFVLGILLVTGGLKVLYSLLNIHIQLSFNLLTSLITIFFVIFSMVLSAYTPGRKASKTSPMEAIRNTNDQIIKKSKRDYRLIKIIFGPEGQLARKNLKRNGRQFGTVTTSLTISVVLFILVSTVVNFLTLEMRQS
ncbi:MAG: ABC transporter permease, partial [Bacilli bacterium]|nr:ABC transporter permease [Bacilli bacterium]